MKDTYSSFRSYGIALLLASFAIGAVSGALGGYFAIQSYLISSSPDTGGSISEQQKVTTIEEDSATIAAVEKVLPSVVSIVITKDFSKIYGSTGPNVFPFDDFFEFGPGLRFSLPGGPGGKQEVGGGTGFIIKEDGLILTNKHVISDIDAEYTVMLQDGQKYTAKVLATDAFNDIAIIKIDAKDLKVVELGDSDAIKIGQTAIAIGNTLAQYENTVTKGIISGKGRVVIAGDNRGMSEKLENVLQTDAAINPGNSGGPLINMMGQVIGVNTAISQEGQLVGFAIPINDAKKSIESVLKYGKIVRPYLGVRYIQINKQISQVNNLSVDYGALILRGASENELAVVPGSPADKAGLVENDIILEINGVKIDDDHQLGKVIAGYNPGDIVKLKTLHKGEEKTINVKLDEAK